jgi:hypothetical protein
MQNKYAKWALVCILLGVTFYTNRNYLRINKVDDTPVTSWVDSEGTTSLLNEYLPTWVDLTNIKNRKFFIESDARISQIKQTSNAINFQYESPKMSKVLVHHMYFPGWKAEIDEKELTIGKTASGSMELYVPAGSQKVSMYFGETAVMKLGNLISLSTTFILFVLFLFQRKNKIKPIKGKKEKTPHKKR